MKASFMVALLLSCVPSEPPTDEESTPTAARVIGTYELEGSQCRVIEVSSRSLCDGCGWTVMQRFSLCDPPLLGMIPGSKPGLPKQLNIP